MSVANTADQLGLNANTSTDAEIKAEVVQQLKTDTAVVSALTDNMLFVMYDTSGNGLVVNFIEEGSTLTITAADTISVVGVFDSIALGAFVTGDFI